MNNAANSNKTLKNFFYTLFFTSITVIGVLIFLLGVFALLISAYHALVFSTTKAAAPIFLTVIPSVTLALAVGVIFFKQPVHNLLCLITVFFSTVVLYLYIGAEFLAFLFLIVYVGAIAILFLFVIMLLHIKELAASVAVRRTAAAFFFLSTVFFVVVGIDDAVSTALNHFLTVSDLLPFRAEASTVEALIWFVNNTFTDILMFSDLLYTYHSYLFYLAAILLLTAMLGAIILATSATDSEK